MKRLTKAEEEVMQVLWELEGGFLKDILEKWPEPKPHGNTIATLLRILVEKGFAAFETRGRNNYYYPLVSKQEYGQRSVNAVIKSYFEGSPARLLSQFVRGNQLSAKELEELSELIRQLKNKEA